jgi:hypothetical protein
MPQDLLPRIFQADLDRLYTRVILPALGNPLLHDNIKTAELATSMAVLLEHAEKHTSNLLAFEARRCFALTLGGLFERQLRIWARVHVPEDQRAGVAGLPFHRLVKEAGSRHGLDLDTKGVGRAIEELHLLANAVRHGEGRSLDKLRRYAPHLWRYASGEDAAKSAARSILSEGIQPSDHDFLRYIRATTRFWGLADREWGAVVDTPY